MSEDIHHRMMRLEVVRKVGVGCTEGTVLNDHAEFFLRNFTAELARTSLNQLAKARDKLATSSKDIGNPPGFTIESDVA